MAKIAIAKFIIAVSKNARIDCIKKYFSAKTYAPRFAIAKKVQASELTPSAFLYLIILYSCIPAATGNIIAGSQPAIVAIIVLIKNLVVYICFLCFFYIQHTCD